MSARALGASALNGSRLGVRMLNARALGVRLLVIVGVLVGGLLFVAGARAVAVHPLLRSFGPEGFGSEGPKGAFGDLQGVAVDQSSGRESSGDVYVYDAGAGAVYKFNSTGEPVAFSKLDKEHVEPANVLTGVGGDGAGEEELAVDSSGGPDGGDIYIANNSTVSIYAESGEKLPSELTGGEACGVAVDPAGDVYVGFYPGTIDEYMPVSNPVTDAELTGTSSAGLSQACNVAVDDKGDVYAATYDGSGGIARLEGLSAAQATPVDASGRTLAVDPASGEVYVDEGSDIALYREEGGVLGRIEAFGGPGAGALSESLGVAVNATTGTSASGFVYADDASGVVEVFGPALTLPSAETGTVSNVGLSGATLTGEVDPEGIAVTSCEFEYSTEETFASSKTAACASLPGSGDSYVAVSAHVSGLELNTTYYYRLLAANKSGSTPGESQSFISFKAPPSVDDKPAFASYVSPLTATLNGTLDPNNAPAGYHFEYGTTTAYGSNIPAPDQIVQAGTADTPVTQEVSGLQPGRTYHFALVADGPGGESIGPDETFQTPPVPPPTVTTGAPGEVTVGAATLTGSVDPQGWETTYYFQYGTTTSYGSRWPSLNITLGGLSGAQAVESSLQNLQPGTVYHYRLVARNPGATSYGADQTFTTLQYPMSAIQEAPVLKTPVGINPESGQSGSTRSTKSPGKGKPKSKKRKQSKKKAKRGRAKSAHRKPRAG
jgi:hypothetical protein